MKKHDHPAPTRAKRISDTSLHGARTKKEQALATLRWIEVRKKREELVDRRLVEREVFALILAERESWLNFPAEVAGTLAAELRVDAATVEILLERLVREQLARMTAATL